MRGITAWGTYLPYRRLDRSEIAPIAGKGGGRGTRAVAGFDEDPTTMAVEAGRRALANGPTPDTLLFGSVAPAYAEKTNATAIHAALRLDANVGAFDLGSSTRSAMSGLLLAACGRGSTLVTSGDIRVGRAGSADEAAGGDAGAAIVIGDDSESEPVLAEIVGTASRTAEFIDRWRNPGDAWSKTWDDKFAEITYGPLGKEVFDAATADVGSVDMVAVSAPTARIAGSLAKRLGVERVLGDLSATVGNCGAAQPALLLAHLLESAEPGSTVALVSVTDGADAIVFRVTDAEVRPSGPTVADQAASGAPVSYGKFLTWRGLLDVDPPRRPEPQRVSATAAARAESWKFGFVGSEDPDTGEVHMPPRAGMIDRPMADVRGTIVTFTIDRVAFSPSPPIVFAVVDFDGGGRLPVELCDIDEADVEIGGRVEMTFRRLGTVDGIPNYFWKGRLARGESRDH